MGEPFLHLRRTNATVVEEFLIHSHREAGMVTVFQGTRNRSLKRRTVPREACEHEDVDREAGLRVARALDQGFKVLGLSSMKKTRVDPDLLFDASVYWDCDLGNFSGTREQLWADINKVAKCLDSSGCGRCTYPDSATLEIAVPWFELGIEPGMAPVRDGDWFTFGFSERIQNNRIAPNGKGAGQLDFAHGPGAYLLMTWLAKSYPGAFRLADMNGVAIQPGLDALRGMLRELSWLPNVRQACEQLRLAPLTINFDASQGGGAMLF